MYQKKIIRKIILLSALCTLTSYASDPDFQQETPQKAGKSIIQNCTMRKCPKCDYKPRQIHNLKIHIARKHPEIKNLYNCRTTKSGYCQMTCPSIFVSTDDLKKHINNTGHMSFQIFAISKYRERKSTKQNKGKKSKIKFTCPYCSYRAKSKYTIFKHLHNRSDHGAYTYECKCHHNVFKHKSSIIKHLAENPTSTRYLRLKKIYNCRECDVFFKTFEELVKHIKKTRHKSVIIQTRRGTATTHNIEEPDRIEELPNIEELQHQVTALQAQLNKLIANK